MFITITPRDIMLILLLGSLCFAFMFWVWPYIVTRAIKRNPGGWGEILGGGLIWFVFLWIMLFYVALLWSPDSNRSWLDAEPAISAVLITIAIFFGYGRFMPASFYAAYLKVTDFKDGTYEDKRLGDLTIEKGQWWPIYLVVHNTSVVTWDNYRITVDLPDGFEASETAGGFPNSRQWNYAPGVGDLKIGQSPCYVQKPSTNVLTIGETSATRFFIKANNGGRFKLKIMVTSAGRIGERRQSLWLNVKDGKVNEG